MWSSFWTFRWKKDEQTLRNLTKFMELHLGGKLAAELLGLLCDYRLLANAENCRASYILRNGKLCLLKFQQFKRAHDMFLSLTWILCGYGLVRALWELWFWYSRQFGFERYFSSITLAILFTRKVCYDIYYGLVNMFSLFQFC